MVRLIARGPIEEHVSAFLTQLGSALEAAAPPEVRVLGPAPAPVMKIKHLFRYHLQLRAPTAPPLQQLLRLVLPTVPVPHKVELAVDVDPVGQL
jgi:primosomal protein N' (replication factor Y)